MGEQAFIKCEDGGWLLSDDYAAILNAETCMFVDEEDLYKNHKRYDGTIERIKDNIANVFQQKYLETKPDEAAVLIDRYSSLIGNHQSLIEWKDNKFYPKKIDSEIIEDRITRTVEYLVNCYSNRIDNEELSRIADNVGKFISNELGGRLTARLTDGQYVNRKSIRKRAPVPHKSLEEFTRLFNRNGFHVLYSIDIGDDGGRPEDKYDRYHLKKLEVKIEENPVAADIQLNAIEQYQKRYAPKKPRARKVQKVKPARINREHLKEMANLLQGWLKSYVEEYTFNHSGFGLLTYWNYQKGIHSAQGWMGKVAMLFMLHNRIPRSAQIRRGNPDWQRLMNVWRLSTDERKKQLHHCNDLILNLDDEASRTPKKHLTKTLT
jgi:hypothetical protein